MIGTSIGGSLVELKVLITPSTCFITPSVSTFTSISIGVSTASLYSSLRYSCAFFFNSFSLKSVDCTPESNCANNLFQSDSILELDTPAASALSVKSFFIELTESLIPLVIASVFSDNSDSALLNSFNVEAVERGDFICSFKLSYFF